MIDALTLDQLRVFVTVVDSGSFRSGAARLTRVQSAISHAIANLEAELAVTLFDRSGHRPALTSEGKALLANARDILLRVDTLRARARGLGEGVELELALVVDTLFPIARVGEALKQMRQHYPSVAIRLSVEPLGGPLEALLTGRCDLAITTGENFRDPRVALQTVSSIDIVAVAAASHPLAARNDSEALAVGELADHLQIVLTDPTPLSSGRDFGVLSAQTSRVNSQDSKYAMILAGLGWGRLPLWLVERDIREGRLITLRTQDLGRRRSTDAYLAHRLDKPLGPAARTFGRALQEDAV